jgi:hypothetical protein
VDLAELQQLDATREVIELGAMRVERGGGGAEKQRERETFEHPAA